MTARDGHGDGISDWRDGELAGGETDLVVVAGRESTLPDGIRTDVLTRCSLKGSAKGVTATKSVGRISQFGIAPAVSLTFVSSSNVDGLLTDGELDADRTCIVVLAGDGGHSDGGSRPGSSLGSVCIIRIGGGEV